MAQSSKTQGNENFSAKDAGILLALLLVAVVVLWPILCAAPAQAPGLPGQDARTQWYPWRAVAADSIRHGSLPLWNPYILCGVPFLGNFQSALFYPPNLIFAVAPMGIAARASILFHVWLSMIFAYLLARMCQCGRGGASVGALAFGLCAAQLLRVPAGHWGVSCAIPWLALVFLSTEWIMRRPTRAALLVGAFAVAMQILSGMPQYVFITALSACFYALIRPLGAGGEPWKGRAERWVMIAGMWLLGAALAAVQLLPGLEAASHGARSLPMSLQWTSTFSFEPEFLLTMIVPGLFGGGTDGSFYWGRWLFWEMNAYIGVAALVLAAYALICERPRRTVVCFAATACVALLLAFGRHTYATNLLALTHMGGMFRGSAKFLLPFSLALSMLAALGADRLLSDPSPKLRRFILCAAVPAAIALAILFSAPGSITSWQRVEAKAYGCLYSYNPKIGSFSAFDPNAQATTASALPAVHDGAQALALLGALVAGCLIFRRKPAAAAFVIFFIVAADGVLFGRDFIGPGTTFLAEGSAWPAGSGRFLRDLGADRRTWTPETMELNDAMLERVPVVEGLEPNPPVRFNELFLTGQNRPVDSAPSVYDLRPGGQVPLWIALGRILAPAETMKLSPVSRVLWHENGWAIVEFPSSATRARVIYQSVVAHSPAEAMKATLASDPRSQVVLEEESTPPASPSTGERTTARIIKEEDTFDRVAVAAELQKPGWLVLRDNDFPGWEAEVDGVPARILRADYAFRAVALSAGSHRVVFRYRPASFYWGIAVSLAALAAAMGIGFTSFRKRARA